MLLSCGMIPVGAYQQSPEVLLCTKRIADSILECRFEGALQIAESLSTGLKADPVGPFFCLCIRALRDVDCNAADDSAGVLDCYRTAMRRIDAYRSAGKGSTDLSSLEGLAKAVYAAHCLNAQKYSRGVQAGLQGLKILKAVKEANPRDFEADFILGTYEYGKAELRQKLWWVLFWYPGTKTGGISMLEGCRDSAVLSSAAAELALAEVYTKESRLDDARRTIEGMLDRYPNSRFVLWSQAKYFEAVQRPGSALEIYSRLEDVYGRIPQAWRNRLYTQCKRAYALRSMGRREEAAQLCRNVLAECRDREDSFVRSICRETRDLQKELER